MTKQNKKNLPLWLQEDKQAEFETEFMTMLDSIKTVEDEFGTIGKLAIRMLDHWGFTPTACISCWSNAGEGYLRKDKKVGLDCATPQEYRRAYSLAAKWTINNLKKFSPKNARKINNAYVKYEQARLDFLKDNPNEFKKADTHAKALLPNKVNNIEFRGKDYSEQSVVSVLKNTEISSRLGKLKNALQSQITLRKNKGKKTSKPKTFTQRVNAKFDELISMLKKADPNVFKKDFDLTNYLEKLEKPKLK